MAKRKATKQEKDTWKKYNSLKEAVINACNEMQKLAAELGYVHMAENYGYSLCQDHNIFEGMLEDDYGPDPTNFNDESKKVKVFKA